MMKRTLILFITICLMCASCIPAFAAVKDDASIQADAIIATANVSLNNSAVATLSVTVYEKASAIRVSSCKLQRKEGKVWVDKGDLPVPSDVAQGMYIYAATIDYSSYCKNGTYRIIATFDIDGYTKAYASNATSY